MKTVTSKDNPVLKSARKLHSRKGREEAGAFLVEGRKLIAEAIAAGFEVDCVFVNAGALLRGEAVPGDCTLGRNKPGGISPGDCESEDNAATVKEAGEIALEERLFCDLARTVSPQPYIAVVRRTGRESGRPERVLVLDRISDPGNAGTMIRTALASGMDEVWCTKETVDIFSDKVIRASAGAVFHLKITEGLSAADCIEKARDIGAKLVVCDANGMNVFKTGLRGSLAIVIGSESRGPADEFSVAADMIAGIPMAEASESLNAATASAIMMYEAMRQRTNEVNC